MISQIPVESVEEATNFSSSTEAAGLAAEIKPQVKAVAVVPASAVLAEEEENEEIAEADINGHRLGVGKTPCRYCGSQFCDFDCDESQAGGFDGKTGSMSKTAEALYTSRNFKSKKDLKEAVATGRKITVYDPGNGMGGEEPPPVNGRCCVAGPHYPEPHRWYATVTLKDGFIAGVK